MPGVHPRRDAPPPSLRRLLAVLAAACLVPVGAAALTDVATGDRVETGDRAAHSPPTEPSGTASPGVSATSASPPAEDGAPAADRDASPESTRGHATTTPTSSGATPPTSAPGPTEPPTTATPTTTTAPSAAPLATPPPPSPTEQVLALVNAARAADGRCEPLRVDDRLTVAAQGHSDDMAERDYFSHTSPEGDTFVDRARAAGYDTPGGENIAAGYRSADAVMDGWMDSPGHAANILECSFTTMGVGLNEDGWYWTQVFGY